MNNKYITYGSKIPNNRIIFWYGIKSTESFDYAKSICNRYYDDCDIIVEIMRYDQPSIFELGRLDSFNSCPDLTQTQPEMGIKLR